MTTANRGRAHTRCQQKTDREAKECTVGTQFKIQAKHERQNLFWQTCSTSLSLAASSRESSRLFSPCREVSFRASAAGAYTKEEEENGQHTHEDEDGLMLPEDWQMQQRRRLQVQDPSVAQRSGMLCFVVRRHLEPLLLAPAATYTGFGAFGNISGLFTQTP